MTTRRLLAAVGSSLGFMLATPAVRAEPPHEAPPTVGEAAVADTVELTDGSFLRGLIVELEPSSHLSLRLPDGQIRRIAMADVVSATRNGKPVALGSAPPKPTAAAEAEAPPESPATTAASPARPAAAQPEAPAAASSGHTEGDLASILAAIPGPRVKLAVTANRSSFLERRIGGASEDAVAYHLVCAVPCQVELPARDAVPYRIGNPRFEPTAWFRVPPYDAKVHAELTSSMWPVWTRSMLVGGFVFGIAGGSMLGINELSGKKSWARDTGLVLAGVGGAFFLTSGLFWLLSPHSTYAVQPAK